LILTTGQILAVAQSKGQMDMVAKTPHMAESCRAGP
jgi:hypothetical protein